MPWYNNPGPVARQQTFGGTPMASTPSGPGGSSYGNHAGMSNGTYNANNGAGHSANGANGSDAGLVYPALHLHPVNDTFTHKAISLAPPGPHNRVKIGRQTNAKTAPHPSNGYFDSKVLSRMHAEVWCQDNKMYIKDVRSSNGTFINNERLSAEGQESEVFELHNEDLVEFGIDIFGDDNKTVVHHKVACRVFLVLTAEDAMGIRNDYASIYRSGGASSQSAHGGALGAVGVGPGAEGGLRRGKATMSFDHIVGQLQKELAKSRETGSEIGALNSAIGEIQESFGAGLPPNSEAPYQYLVPQAKDERSHSEDSRGEGSSSSSASSAAVAALQAQLAETQASMTAQNDKIRSLESLLSDHELIKSEVGSIKTQIEEAKRERDEMASARQSLLAGGTAASMSQLKSRDAGHTNGLVKKEDDEDFDDGASMVSMDTVTPGADESSTDANGEEEEDGDGHVGPRAPPDLPPGLQAAEGAAAGAVASKAVSANGTSAFEEQLQAQNKALTARLDSLEGQLQEALSFGRTLQSQHTLAAETVQTLQEKIESLEAQVSKNVETALQGRITEALEGRFSQWKDQIEAGWKKERLDWEEEREHLRAVVAAWDHANGRLEEQASHQVALAGSSSSSGSGSFDSPLGSGGDSPSSSNGVGGRRRASKSAKRRAAKRHLNPALRALLYKSSHNGSFEDDSAYSSDEEGLPHGGGGSSGSSSGAGGSATPRGVDDMTLRSNDPHTSSATSLSSLGNTLSSSLSLLRGGPTSSESSADAWGSNTIRGPKGSPHSANLSRQGPSRGGVGPAGGGGERSTKEGAMSPNSLPVLSAAVLLVGVAAWAFYGKEGSSR